MGQSVFVDELRDPSSSVSFYIVRWSNSSSLATGNFQLRIRPKSGAITVPLTLSGRVSDPRRRVWRRHPALTLAASPSQDSKVVVDDFAFGTTTLSYCTAAIFAATSIGGRDVLVLHGDLGQRFQLGLLASLSTVKVVSGSVSPSYKHDGGVTSVDFTIPSRGLSVVQITTGGKSLLVLIADTVTAYTAWQPTITSSYHFGNHFGVGTNETVVVLGP